MAEINLLTRDLGSARGLPELEEKLQIGAWWSLVALLGSGIVIGALFFFLQAKSDQSNTYNRVLRQQIDAQLVKEGILVSLKERANIAGKALAADRPWGNLFPILNAITQVININTLTIDETGKVSIQLKLGSVDEAVTVVTNMLSLANQHTVRSPQLLSFAIKDDGAVQMGMSFIPSL